MRTASLALVVAVAVAVAGCSGASAPTSLVPSRGLAASAQPAPSGSGGLPTSPASATSDHSQRGRSGGGATGGGATVGQPANGLPADFPAAVPLPAGAVASSGGVDSRWSVLLVVPGPADVVQRDALAFYLSRGWVAAGANGVHTTGWTVAVVSENRDHSATETNLTVVVARD